MSAPTPPRLLDLAGRHLLRAEDLDVSTLESVPTELFPPLFLEAFDGYRTETLSLWCKPFPLSACQWGTSFPRLMWGRYKQCWKHLMSCWPRRFIPGECDQGTLIKSWVYQGRQLG